MPIVNKKYSIITSLLILSTFLCSGCAVVGNKCEIRRKNEAINKVEFESEEAGLLFHAQRKRDMSNNEREREQLIIPFMILKLTIR